jgi:SAM-dependent methyltransferase
MPNNFFFRDSCRICLGKDIQKVIVLTPTPPGNSFINFEQLGETEEKYPLDIYFCNSCFHIQLGHVVKPEILYQNNYSYVSSTSSVFVSHLEDYSKKIVKSLNLEKGSLVIDIGSNDGTCLKFFKEQGMKVLGVDPAVDIAKNATDNGIETIGDFFSLDLATSIREKYGSADFVTSHNALAHIDDLDEVFSGVKTVLKKDGVFVMEVGYFLDVYQNTWFDTIYHEHTDYHTLGPLQILFERFDMEVFKVERIKPQGGSIRVYAQNISGSNKKDETVEALIKLEEQIGLYNPKTFIDFENHINRIRDELFIIIHNLKKDGKTIAAYGAPTKATTLCHHFQLGSDKIDFIVDDNPLKQGLFSPGKNIEVCNRDKISVSNPDYLLILAWNFSDSIMQNNQDFKKNGGSFILPMPEPKIV